MRALATKSTLKKNKYNKRELAKKLDKLAEKVSSKDIFVVSKPNDFYAVLNYKTQQPFILDIPNKRVADRLCGKANCKPLSRDTLKRIRRLLDDYHRYFTDTLYFQHTITKSSDEITVESAKHRLDLTNGRMRIAVVKLLTI